MSDVYMTQTAWVKFVSEAPLETIEAENNRVKVVLNVAENVIALRVPITAFEGFNSPLQHEHFDENYMESNQYPQATFEGKIIEDVDLSLPGTYKVRAKGILSIHGEEKERIISGTIKVESSMITVRSSFEVPLEDFNITIPRVVAQKIAEVIQVELKAELKPNS
ncbi:MAG: YceI family protein [Flavobacteriales bacterium]|nr:YceI family protein [Flavobacteriales bacterium]